MHQFSLVYQLNSYAKKRRTGIVPYTIVTISIWCDRLKHADTKPIMKNAWATFTAERGAE